MSPGMTPNMRLGQMGEQIVTQLHGRYYEQAYRGNLYMTGGVAVAALSANTITLTATTTPIIGLWNPTTSPVNAVLLEAGMQLITVGNSAVAPGAFVWAASLGNGAISTGIVPYSGKTLAAAGSYCKGFHPGIALTGLTNNLVIFMASDFGTLVVAQGATGTPIISPPMKHVFDGSIIVPPGGCIALLNTISVTTVSIIARLLWTEVPL
jgi:hypothetical protein